MNSFTLSPIIISERERAENLCGERKKEDLVSSKKKEKKSRQSREESEKTKKMNNELLRALV